MTPTSWNLAVFSKAWRPWRKFGKLSNWEFPAEKWPTFWGWKGDMLIFHSCHPKWTLCKRPRSSNNWMFASKVSHIYKLKLDQILWTRLTYSFQHSACLHCAPIHQVLSQSFARDASLSLCLLLLCTLRTPSSLCDLSVSPSAFTNGWRLPKKKDGE